MPPAKSDFLNKINFSYGVSSLGKEPREITFPDFVAHGMRGLVQRYYPGSPFEALFDAKLVTKEDEFYIRSLFHGNAA